MATKAGSALSPFALLAIAAASGAGGAVPADERPNVVLVITDDQGYGDLGCHGNPVLRTPNLDRLHDEAVRLVDFHVAPICSPTRAALVTGRWTNRTGVWHTSGGRGPAASCRPPEGLLRSVVGRTEARVRRGPAIYLGHDSENPARLTSQDWITTESPPWNQALVRRALGNASATGYWNVNVARAGDYEIGLRRWPREADLTIDAPLPPGADVPGDRPFRASAGRRVPAVKASVRVGHLTAQATVEPGAKEVRLRVTLPAGKTRMTALFSVRDGSSVGAFYVYVKRL